MRYRDFGDKPLAVLIATGPSITQEQLDHVHAAFNHPVKCRRFITCTINNVYQRVPWTNVHISCDEPWWQHYGADVIEKIPNADKWTYYPHIAEKFGINCIKEAWGPGLYTADREHIHIGHSSGFMVLNLAYHYGCREFILLGYDMTYPKDYNAKKRDPGGLRHYFGEYPKHLQHWPSIKVGLSGAGHLDGLIEMYNSIDEKELNIKIWNCTPGSVLECFEKANIGDIL